MEIVRKVVFTPEASQQLVDLYRYLAMSASSMIADNYTESLIQYCEGLSLFPYRGVSRSDIRQGVRITHFKKRTVIAFSVSESAVSILGVFHGGRDYGSLLSECHAEYLAEKSSQAEAALALMFNDSLQSPTSENHPPCGGFLESRCATAEFAHRDQTCNA